MSGSKALVVEQGLGEGHLGKGVGKQEGFFLRGMAWTPNQDMCEMSENYTGVGKLWVISSRQMLLSASMTEKFTAAICPSIHHPPIHLPIQPPTHSLFISIHTFNKQH